MHNTLIKYPSLQIFEVCRRNTDFAEILIIGCFYISVYQTIISKIRNFTGDGKSMICKRKGPGTVRNCATPESTSTNNDDLPGITDINLKITLSYILHLITLLYRRFCKYSSVYNWICSKLTQLKRRQINLLL